MRSHPGIIPGVQCVHPDGSGELGNTHCPYCNYSIHTDKVRFVLTSQSSLPIRNNIWNKYTSLALYCTILLIWNPCTTNDNCECIQDLASLVPPATWQREGPRSTDCSRLSRVILPISSQTTLCQYLKGISKTIRIFII